MVAIRSCFLALLVVISACTDAAPERSVRLARTLASGATAGDDRADERERLSASLAVAGIGDEMVLDALRRVPRHRFVPKALASRAYADRPLPIGKGQTISQPYIVAYMTEKLEVRPLHRVLEIGTGSGYQAAVLAELAAQVYSVEIVAELSHRAATVLAELGYDDVHLRIGDGWAGWSEAAPFDRIILTAAPSEIPRPLIDQLAAGGRLIAPLTDPLSGNQWIWLLKKDADGRVSRERLLAVRFVPMTGRVRDETRH